MLNERVDQLLVEASQMGFELDEVLKLMQRRKHVLRQPKKEERNHE
ncbi:MAG UNVERIFIED_CONTAM: hypothetical protein LVR29_14225 [Microcystis novacekii LVE1205-3]